jgi:hypothetical protein
MHVGICAVPVDIVIDSAVPCSACQLHCMLVSAVQMQGHEDQQLLWQLQGLAGLRLWLVLPPQRRPCQRCPCRPAQYIMHLTYQHP